MTDKEFVIKLAERIVAEGGQVFYVGGYVRDMIMKRPNKDIDIEIHNITVIQLEEILADFGTVDLIGKSFGVYKVSGYDVDIALPRTEKKCGDKHTDFEISVNPFMTYEEAASRRDFTMNSIGIDVLTLEVYDPFNGIDDIKRRIIRHIDDKTFIEDELRVFRAAQFAARFKFEIAPETIELCSKISVKHLPKERVFEELKKALLRSATPSIFFNSLREMKQLDYWFPCLEKLINCPQNQLYHTNDAYEHTMNVLDMAAMIKNNTTNPLAFLISAVAHDVGKAETITQDDKGIFHNYGHEKIGVLLRFPYEFCNDISINKYVNNMIENHMRLHTAFDRNSKLKITNKIFDDSIAPLDLIYLSYCDEKESNPDRAEKEIEFAFDRYKEFIEIINKPYVMGRDLIEAGLTPSKNFSKLLSYAHKLRLAAVPKESALKQVLNYKIEED